MTSDIGLLPRPDARHGAGIFSTSQAGTSAASAPGALGVPRPAAARGHVSAWVVPGGPAGGDPRALPSPLQGLSRDPRC
jgi:hypothetical protein